MGDLVQNQFFDLYRAGLRSAVDVMTASLETTVRLQQQQLDMVRNALEENSRSTDRRRSCSAPDSSLVASSTPGERLSNHRQ